MPQNSFVQQMSVNFFSCQNRLVPQYPADGLYRHVTVEQECTRRLARYVGGEVYVDTHGFGDVFQNLVGFLIADHGYFAVVFGEQPLRFGKERDKAGRFGLMPVDDDHPPPAHGADVPLCPEGCQITIAEAGLAHKQKSIRYALLPFGE